MSIFKPQIGKVFFGQTVGGQSVICPFFFNLILSLVFSLIYLKMLISVTEIHYSTFLIIKSLWNFNEIKKNKKLVHVYPSISTWIMHIYTSIHFNNELCTLTVANWVVHLSKARTVIYLKYQRWKKISV